MIGGRILGSGKSGCVFDPAPPCAGGTVFKSLGKLVREDVSSELRIGRQIMRLPTASAYFSAATQVCVPETPVRDPDASKCEMLTKPEKFDNYPLGLLAVQDAGITLDDYAQGNLQRLIDNYKHIAIHLLEGLVVLHKNGIVHNDIHAGNILVDRLNVARFIDFGRSFKINEIRKWEDVNLSKRFSPSYVLHPPELHTWTMIRAGIQPSVGIRQMLEKREYYQLQDRFPERFPLESAILEFIQRDPILKKRQEALRAGDNTQASKAGGEFIRTYGKGFDLWRIGIVLFWMWNENLLPWLGFQRTRLYLERASIMRAIAGLTDYDPTKRFSAKTALSILDPGNRLAAD